MVENLVTVEKLVSIVPPAKTLPGVIQSILIGDRVVKKVFFSCVKKILKLYTIRAYGFRNIQDCRNAYFWPQRAFKLLNFFNL